MAKAMHEPLKPEQTAPEPDLNPLPEDNHPLVLLTDEGLAMRLKRAMRNTLLLGLVPSVAVWIGSGWRNAAMLVAGTAISAASILEWRRMIALINAKMDAQKAPRGAMLAAVFFVLRLTVFAAIIYVSLKCFKGSLLALLCGLSLSVLAVGWEALSLLRD